jgi:iron complex outermembrane receptor protein
VPGLRAVVNMGYDVTSGERRAFLPSTLKAESTPDTGKVTIQNPYKYSRLFEGYLNYKKTLAQDHKIDITAGYSWQDFYSENYGFNATHLSTNVYGYNNPTVASLTVPWNPGINLNRLISFYGRVNYSYKDKYLVTANIRRDGSTRFGPLNRWGTFPSVAVGWQMLNESFLQGLSNSFTELKLRAGYGVVGNQDIGNYLYLPSYTPSDAQSGYQFGSSYLTTIRPSGYDNSLKWEQTATTNIGLDFGVLNGRLTGAVEVYQKNTSNLLFNRSVAPGANLTNQITTNVGKMQNQGIELTLNGVAVDKGDLQWNLSFNAAYNKNVIKVLDGNDDPSYAGYLTGAISGGVGNNVEILRVGQPVNSFYVYQHKNGPDGKPVSDNLGNAALTDMYVDQNGDGSINEKDLRPYKKPLPTFILGLTSNTTYKNWDLSFTLRANLGNYNYNNVASGSTYQNFADNYWPRNMVTQVINANYYRPQYFSDYYVQNASFLRMDNITLGYNLSKISNSNLKVRVYGTVQNVFVLTKYQGLDPELAANTGTGGTAGVDNNIYPRARTFTLGIRVGF